MRGIDYYSHVHNGGGSNGLTRIGGENPLLSLGRLVEARRWSFSPATMAWYLGGARPQERSHALNLLAAPRGVGVVTVADLIPWLNPSWYGGLGAWRQWTSLLFGPALRHAGALVAISGAAASDLYEWTGRAPDRVIHPVLPERLQDLLTRGGLYSVDRRGVLIVGEDDPRKRHHAAVDVAASEKTHLTWVGHRTGATPRHRQSEQDLLAYAERQDVEVRRLADADDKALAGAYRSHSVLVVTSRREGFCLPVAEALLAGCPVAAYDPFHDMDWIGEVFGDTYVPVAHRPEDAVEAARSGYDRARRRMGEMCVYDTNAFMRAHEELYDGLGW